MEYELSTKGCWRLKILCQSLFVSKYSKTKQLVCPSHLRVGLYIVAALDNLDYDPTSTTAIGSFHGTGISIIQFLTNENLGISRQLLSFAEGDVLSLPDEYRIVPARFLESKGALVPESMMKENKGSLQTAQKEEQL